MDFPEVERLASRLGRVTASALIVLALSVSARGQQRPAQLELPDPLTVETALAIEDDYTRNYALYRVGSSLMRDGRVDEAAALASRMDMPLARLSMLRDLANHEIRRDRLGPATTYLADAVAIVDRLSDPESRKLSYLDLAVLQGKVGDQVGSRESFRKATRMIREQGGIAEQREQILKVITVQARIGDLEGAMATARFNNSIIGESLAEDLVTVEMINLLRPLARPGSFEAALGLVESVDSWKPRVAGYALVGSALRRAERLRESDETFGKAMAVYESLRRPRPRIESMRMIANMQAESDHPDARGNYVQALELTRLLDDESAVAIVAELIDSIALAASLEEAEAVLAEVDADFARTVGHAVLGQKWVDRRQFLKARTAWNDALESRGSIADSEQHDRAVRLVAAVQLRAGALQAEEDRAIDSRSSFQDAMASAAMLAQGEARDLLYHQIALAQAEAGDLTAAQRTIEKIGARTQQGETAQAVKRIEARAGVPG